MQTFFDTKRAKYHFNSLREMGEWIDATPRQWRQKASEKCTGDHSWDLGASYADAVRMARQGWIEGAERMQDALRSFNVAQPQPDQKYDVYGFRPHVARYCAGAPDNMIRHDYSGVNGSGKMITLYVPVNANSMTKAECMANFGVAVAQYVNQLEQEGKRVELVACFVNDWESPTRASPRAWRETFSITLKHADQPLDLAVVAFAIGHPAMFRRLGFALLERAAAPEHHGYAFSVDATLTDFIDPPHGTFILNGMKDANSKAKTPESALKYVSEQIEKAMSDEQIT